MKHCARRPRPRLPSGAGRWKRAAITQRLQATSGKRSFAIDCPNMDMNELGLMKQALISSRGQRTDHNEWAFLCNADLVIPAQKGAPLVCTSLSRLACPVTHSDLSLTLRLLSMVVLWTSFDASCFLSSTWRRLRGARNCGFGP